MRLNVFIAQASGLSRRSADKAIDQGRILVNGQQPEIGQQVSGADTVSLDGSILHAQTTKTTIMLNKPIGYVCSRDGQGSRTIYDLLPPEYHKLKPVGRLDKDSSGLLLLTDDGQLANELTHPKYKKTKVYEVELDKPLTPQNLHTISRTGLDLEDGPSKLMLEKLDQFGKSLKITMSEGRNRQIRRTFEALGYKITNLHRTGFGVYQIGGLSSGKNIQV